METGKAEELIKEKRYYEAKKILSAILINEPENTFVMNELAEVSILEENYEDALRLINVILEIDPLNKTANLNAKLLTKNNNVSELYAVENISLMTEPGYKAGGAVKKITNKESNGFCTPHPDLDYIEENSERIFDYKGKSTQGVNLNEPLQLELLDYFTGYYKEVPFPLEKNDKFRYYFNNGFYSYGDAVINYFVMRHFKPKRIIEVGSGYSSACMLDTSDKFLQSRVQFTFIDPFADKLKSLIYTEDRHRHRIIEAPVQSVEPHEFEVLGINDILFIDSSHIVKTGSDIEYLFTEVIPVLNKGVIIHFHNIYYPFEYPRESVFEGKAWNEIYFVKSFLQYNNTFSILYFNSLMQANYADILSQKTPNLSLDSGSGLWIRKDN